jgi:hypothetical protein
MLLTQIPLMRKLQFPSRTVNFDWIWSSSCLFHHQKIVDGILRKLEKYLFHGGASEGRDL